MKLLYQCALPVAMALLVGCATTSALPPRDASGNLAVISPAGFKLQKAQVRWVDNADFAVRLKQTVPLAASAIAAAVHDVAKPASVVKKPGSELRVYQPSPLALAAAQPQAPSDPKILAEAYVGEILTLFREHGASKVSSMLAASGIADGSTHDIVMTPVSGFQSIDGWGTHVVIRTLVREVSTGRSWQTDLQVNSGIHWVGVAHAAKPTAEFVDQYVSGLRDALRHAGAL